MALTDKQKVEFYKKKRAAKRIVKQHVKKRKLTIFGARALNAHLPSYLDTDTEDYDIFSNTPKRSATRIEKKLDRHFGGDFYVVEPALHPGTYKVKSRVTKKNIADVTKPKKHVPTKTIRNTKYASLAWIKRKRNKILRDPSARFRHDKDREALQRIRLHEKRTR